MKRKLIEFVIGAVIVCCLFLIGVVFAVTDANNAPVTFRSDVVSMSARSPWSINSSDNALAGGEVLKDAPGSGSYLNLQYVVISCNTPDTVTILNGSSTLLGPFAFDNAGSGFLVIDLGETGIQLTANSSLGFSTAGAATQVCVFVKGYTN